MGVKFNVLFTDVIRKLPHDTCTLHGVCVCVCVSNEASQVQSVSERLIIIRTSQIHRFIKNKKRSPPIKPQDIFFFPYSPRCAYISFIHSSILFILCVCVCVHLTPFMSIKLLHSCFYISSTRSLTHSCAHRHRQCSLVTFGLAVKSIRPFIKSCYLYPHEHQPLPFIRLSIDHTELLIIFYSFKPDLDQSRASERR